MAMSGLSGAYPEPSPVFTRRKIVAVPPYYLPMRSSRQIPPIATRFALALATLVASSGAHAATQPIVASAHSSTAPQNCWPVDGSKQARDDATRVCRGKANWVVLVNRDDGRDTVSIGHNRVEAAKEPAAQASFGPFKAALTSIEWRSAGNNPFAIIQPWRATDSDPKPMFVVT